MMQNTEHTRPFSETRQGHLQEAAPHPSTGALGYLGSEVPLTSLGQQEQLRTSSEGNAEGDGAV